MAITKTQVSQLYVSIFGRASEGEGNTFWQTSATTTTAADLMFQQQVVKDYFNVTDFTSEVNVRTVVETIYLNALGKTPTDDPTGIQFWVDSVIVNGDSIGTMAAALTFAATQPANAGTAQDIFNNKVAVSDHTADTVPTFTGFAQFQGYIANVDETQASVDAAIIAVDTDVPVVDLGLTLAANTNLVTEGNAVTFTVTANQALTVDKVLSYQVSGVAAAGGTADPLTDLGILNGTVTILAGQTTATITLTPTDDAITEGFEGFQVNLLDDNFATLTSSGVVVIQDAPNAGQTFTLTTGVDSQTNFTGGIGNDIYTGVIDETAGNTTFTSLDYLDGGDGVDTFNLNVLDGTVPAGAGAFTALPNATVKNIETFNIASAVDIGATGAGNQLDFSSYTDVTNLNITQAAKVYIEAANTADISVSNASDLIQVDGGKNISVSDATADKNITIGATTAATDAITVTDTKQGTGNIAIDGGTDVTVTSTVANTAAGITSGTIVVGAVTAATGAVVINDNLNSDGVAALTGGNITVTGGTTVDVTIAATATPTLATSTGNTITAGNITVNSDGNTTAVTTTSTYSETEFSVAAAGGTTETASVQFGLLKSGDSVTLSVNNDAIADATELTFTAAKDLTAAEVAAAFANLVNLDKQSETGPTSNGIFTGALSLWTGSAATTDTVVFTSTTANTNMSNLQVVLTNTSTNSVAATVTTTDGAALSTAASTTANAGVYGAVRVDGNATASITTVTLDGFASADLGSTGVDLNALTTLILANNTAGGNVDVATSSTTLAMTVNNITSTAAVIDLDKTAATVSDLTITATGAASTFDLTDTALANLTIDAAANLNIATTPAGYATTNLLTVDVNGAGTVNLGGISSATAINSFDATGNTGGVTATVETDGVALTGNITEYKFSDGADNVTVVDAVAGTTTVDTSITTNAGNDTVTLFTGVTGFAAGKTIDAGADTDTLSMAAADLTTVTGGASFQGGIAGFERVTVGATTSAVAASVANTLDLANLDNISYVNVSGVVSIDNTADATDALATLSISNLAANGTVNLTSGIINSTADAQGLATLNIALADDTGSSDVLNLAMTDATDSTGITNTGSVVANNIETININVSDLFVDANNDGIDDGTATHTLVLTADATTINVEGSSNLNLANATTFASLITDTSLTLIDASNMTGVLIATATNNSETIKGGSGNDVLKATGSQGTLLGGAGNDTLVAGDLTTLTGGAGNDTFVMTVPTNVNSYATITDATAGDVIDLNSLIGALDNGSTTTNVVFTASAVTLAGTAVFQDYANAAVNALGTDNNDVAWFNYDGNTYLVQSGDATANNDFQSGVDSIIQLSGVIDLSTASYNQDYGTLEIA